MIKTIFGDKIWINSFDTEYHNNYKNLFYSNINNNINTNTWEHCNVKSSFFNKEFVNNKMTIDFDNSLGDKIKDEFNKFILKLSNENNVYINITPKIQKLWYNNYTYKDNQEIHHHIGKYSHMHADLYSFIYILHSVNNDDCASLFFHNHRSSLFSALKINEIINIPDYQPFFKPNLNEGEIIIFPSHMEHYVSSHKDIYNDRISISGNIKCIINS